MNKQAEQRTAQKPCGWPWCDCYGKEPCATLKQARDANPRDARGVSSSEQSRKENSGA